MIFNSFWYEGPGSRGNIKKLVYRQESFCQTLMNRIWVYLHAIVNSHGCSVSEFDAVSWKSSRMSVHKPFHFCMKTRPAFNNRNTRTRCEICSKQTIKTPERRHWRRSGVFIVKFEHISHLFLVFLLLTLNMQMPAGNCKDRLFTISRMFHEWLRRFFPAFVMNWTPEIPL